MLRGVKQLVIAGMKTEFCVDTTCRAAPELGFTTVLISDAHTTIDNPHLSAHEIIGHHNRTLAGPFVALSTAADWRFDEHQANSGFALCRDEKPQAGITL